MLKFKIIDKEDRNYGAVYYGHPAPYDPFRCIVVYRYNYKWHKLYYLDQVQVVKEK